MFNFANKTGLFSFVAAIAALVVLPLSASAGTGTFGTPTTYDLPGGAGAGAVDVVSQDFDQDGDKDVAVALATSKKIVFYKNTDGSGILAIDAPRTIDLVSRPISLTTSELDGHPELGPDLAIGLSSGNIQIRGNDGTGFFPDTAPSRQTVLMPGGDVADITAADIDGNHFNDLASIDASADFYHELFNASGTFGFFTTGSTGGSALTAITTTDIDGDIEKERLITSSGDHTLRLVDTTGVGGSATVGNNPRDVVAGSFDAVEGNDAVVAVKDDNAIQIVHNESGTFKSGEEVGVGTSPVSLTQGDIDNDTDLDIAVANSGSGNVSVLTNDGAGNFSIREALAVGAAPSKVQFGLLNPDATADLLELDNSQGKLNVFLGALASEDTTVQSTETAVDTGTSTTTPTTAAVSAGVFSLSAQSKTVSSKRKYTVKAKISRAGKVKISASITIAGKKYKLSSVTKSLTSTSYKKVSLKLSKKVAKLVRKRIKANKKLKKSKQKKVKIKVKATGVTSDAMAAVTSKGKSSVSKSATLTKSNF